MQPQGRLRALLSLLETVLLDGDEAATSINLHQGLRGKDDVQADLSPQEILQQLLLVSCCIRLYC
jgi:hypothetical protein